MCRVRVRVVSARVSVMIYGRMKCLKSKLPMTLKASFYKRVGRYWSFTLMTNAATQKLAREAVEI